MADYERDGAFFCFQLEDADGELHEYKLKPHGGDDGQVIVYRLLGLGSEPLGEVLQGLSKAEEIREKLADAWSEGGVDAVIDNVDPLELLDAIDFAGLGSSVKKLLAEGDPPPTTDKPGAKPGQGKIARLINDILAETWRDDQHLKKRLVRQEAYARNYGELLQAVYHSVAINRFFPASGIFGTGSDEKPKKDDPELDDD